MPVRHGPQGSLPQAANCVGSARRRGARLWEVRFPFFGRPWGTSCGPRRCYLRNMNRLVPDGGGESKARCPTCKPVQREFLIMDGVHAGEIAAVHFGMNVRPWCNDGVTAERWRDVRQVKCIGCRAVFDLLI